MIDKKKKSIGLATLKTLGAQYSSFFGIVEQVATLHSDFESELTQVLSLLHEKHNVPTQNEVTQDDTTVDAIATASLENEKNDSSPKNNEAAEDLSTTEDLLPTDAWVKKLFKRIATHCHPDKVISSKFSATEKHKRLSSYEQARSALDEINKPMIISIGLLYDELPGVGTVESKKILLAGVTKLQTELDSRQKSVVWSWGMSEDDLSMKSKILVHAAKKMYNRQITEHEALSVVKEFFEIREKAPRRTIGSHPGSSLKSKRKK